MAGPDRAALLKKRCKAFAKIGGPADPHVFGDGAFEVAIYLFGSGVA